MCYDGGVRRVTFWIAIFVAAAAPCQPTESGCWVPGFNQEMPKYFSCTNARASGEAFVYPKPPGGPTSPWFVEADLYVGYGFFERHVRHWERGGETEFPHISLAAMFDSTAFGSQSWVTVRFRAVDNYNRTYEDSNSSQNKNLAFCFGHPEFWYWPTNGASRCK